MRIKFFYKLLALCLAIALVAVAAANLTFALTAKSVIIRGLGAEAIRHAVWAAGQVRAEQYQALVAGELKPAEASRGITQELLALQEKLGHFGVENVYVLAAVGEDIFVAGDPSGEDLPLAVKDTTNLGLKKKILQTGKPDFTEPYSDQWGTWISGYAPLYNHLHRPIALLGVDLPLGAFPLMHEIIRRNTLVSLIPSLLLALVCSYFFSRLLAHPIRRLTEGLQRVQNGEFETAIQVRSRDELGRMGEAFNAMVRDLGEKERIRMVFQQAVSREVAEEMLSGRLNLEGEIREATVLFSDIRGFTAMAEGMAAREIINLLNEYFSVLAPLISARGGIVDKFVGDEIFAVFGVPVTLQDEAMAAVEAAMAMQRAVAELNERRRAQGRKIIQVGIGLNTGAVVAGTIGSKERLNYTVPGQTVNIGARLCSQAGPGQILISQYTYLRVKERIKVKQLPPLTVKGVTFPLNIFEVLEIQESAHV